MVQIHQLAYSHPNRDVLFKNLSFSLADSSKTGLAGNNGSGKSTLLKLIAGELSPASGSIFTDDTPWFIPQNTGQFSHLTVARALKADSSDFENPDGRCREALGFWGLSGLDLSLPLGNLSSGQQTTVFLAGLTLHQPRFVLMDEPGNHLDEPGRSRLERYIRKTKSTLLLVSHDRDLLNLMDEIAELTGNGISLYGGNYDFFSEQKQLATDALYRQIAGREKELRLARETERVTAERQNRSNSRGRRKQEKAGTPKIMMNALRNKAENSTARLKDIHQEKMGRIESDLNRMKDSLPAPDKIRFGLSPSRLHRGKILLRAENLNFTRTSLPVWKQPLGFTLLSGDRVVLSGKNGSGKTTLINLITGQLSPTGGTLYRSSDQIILLDQTYSLIQPSLTILEQAWQFNTGRLQEHDLRIRLIRFLFGKEDWGKPCGVLSGGERMRLLLCCLTILNEAPDLIILDEPTNNLDLQNRIILSRSLQNYQGTLLIVSHDGHFVRDLNPTRLMALDPETGLKES